MVSGNAGSGVLKKARWCGHQRAKPLSEEKMRKDVHETATSHHGRIPSSFRASFRSGPAPGRRALQLRATILN